MPFADQQYAGETFSSISLTGEAYLDKEFEKCIFDTCSLIGCEFKECKFTDCTFTGSLLSALKLPGCTFVDTVFKESKVMGMDWSRVAKMRNIQFLHCELSQSNFSFMKLPHLVMHNCTVKESYITDCDCTDADFEGTDFARTIFSRANLTNANFKGATNYGIDFQNNTLKKTKFSLPEAVSLLNALDIILE
ncbi:MAG: McbG-like protein [Candidatus Peribacteria bacterium]|nr:McbG-like protein [Candidatus Peribacteria bacterium]